MFFFQTRGSLTEVICPLDLSPCTLHIILTSARERGSKLIGRTRQNGRQSLVGTLCSKHAAGETAAPGSVCGGGRKSMDMIESRVTRCILVGRGK